MSGPYQDERERCLVRSQFSSPDARRRAAAAEHGPTEQGPPKSPLGLPAASPPTGPSGPLGPAAPGRVVGPGSRGTRPCRSVRIPQAARQLTSLPRPCRNRGACAVAGVAAPGSAVAVAPAGGRPPHTRPGSSVHAGVGHPVGVVRLSRRRAGLAAGHASALPSGSGWYQGLPGPLRVPPRIACTEALRLARADRPAALTWARPQPPHRRGRSRWPGLLRISRWFRQETALAEVTAGCAAGHTPGSSADVILPGRGRAPSGTVHDQADIRQPS